MSSDDVNRRICNQQMLHAIAICKNRHRQAICLCHPHQRCVRHVMTCHPHKICVMSSDDVNRRMQSANASCNCYRHVVTCHPHKICVRHVVTCHPHKICVRHRQAICMFNTNYVFVFVHGLYATKLNVL